MKKLLYTALSLFVISISQMAMSQENEPKTLRTFYPPIDSYQTGFLQVDQEHTLYWEEARNPSGKPIIFLA